MKLGEKTYAKPFVKWAGGKRQLIAVINESLPSELKEGKITRYIEPFVGGGAMLFYLSQNYKFDEIIINDLNLDLINIYITIKNDVNKLIEELRKLSYEYFKLDNEDRKDYYSTIRSKFNNDGLDEIKKSAYFIFLNRTCFNGLYRVNKKGQFNVPYGKYKKPLILDEDNLLNVSKLLQNVTIFNKDFEDMDTYIDENTFVYFDPPYRPLNKTSSFTSYNEYKFDDREQIRLANFYKKLSSRGAKLMLSNSDPKNVDSSDDFFDILYKENNIIRVGAKRNINSNANKRGKINELLILNY
ncbi:DNA adenine methylase [Anaerosalibacter massiliensis]|uniref:Site-specific DNA-methyltransferase (adenine-specific) n=1 Tax=Anaerosalibacter massiliensis TaxID=1347392 RepID=A0A9X2S4D9_9FIRM|nr:DNA adenine methylase [Anaerosalibacter massiliensis]MCR2043650.1 DNA adenine methylase [Anaerosalibacter massiliensis]